MKAKGTIVSTLTPERRLHVHVLTPAEAEREFTQLEGEIGSYSSLLEKAGRETLSADERAHLRRMKNLLFLLNRAA